MKRKQAISLTSLLVSAVMMLSLAGCGSSGTGAAGGGSDGEGKIVIKIGHVLPESHPYHAGLQKLQEILDEKAPGAVQLDLFPNSTMGGERDMLEGMQMGTMDAAVLSTASLSNFSDQFKIFDLPFLFPSYDQAYEVLDGEIGQGLINTLSEVGLVGVAYWENGFRHITNNKADIYLPADLPKGFKIRTMENEIQMQTFISLGANAIPMAWSEVYTALQQGTIDGQENPLAVIYSSKIQEVNRYITMTGHVYAPAPVVFSKKVWDSYPEDIQTLLRESIEEARIYQREVSRNSEAELAERLEQEGCSVIRPEDVDKAAWRSALQPVYDQYQDKIGTELVQEVMSVINA